MKTEQIDDAVLETWTPEEVAQAMQSGEIVLIDVRSPQEYMHEHIEGALLMPLSDFNPGRLPGQSEKRIVLHCGSGKRSETAARRMIEEDSEVVVAHLGGGFGAWKKAGQPFIGTDFSTGAPKKQTAD